MPSATEPAELHTEIHDHRQNEQRETATDNAPRSLSEAAQNDDAGSEAHRPAPSAAVATQLYHPQATSLLKHKCLPQDNSLNIEDDGGNGVDKDQDHASDFIESSGSLDVEGSKSPVRESSEQFAFSQYVQETSLPPTLA